MYTEIKNENDYIAAVARVSQLMDKEFSVGGTEDSELESLIFVIEAYEHIQYPISPPDPIEAILFRVDQQR